METATIRAYFESALQNQRLGHLAEAETLYRKVLAGHPNHLQARNNLGIILFHLGRDCEAIGELESLIRISPVYAEARNNLGIVLARQQRLDEAADAFRGALSLRPDYVDAWNGLGNVLKNQGYPDQAEVCYRHAIRHNQNHALSFYNLGNVLQLRKRLDDAAAAYNRALLLEPNNADIYHNLANVFLDQGLSNEAVCALRHANELFPEDSNLYSDLIVAQYADPKTDRACVLEDLQRWHFLFGTDDSRTERNYQNDRRSERMLRVAYVSSNLYDHVVGRNLRPLFLHHDHVNLAVMVYSGDARSDWLSEEFRGLATEWHDIERTTAEDLDNAISKQRIDVLVDLNQHTGGNRLTVFARRPAPVQVSFAAYPEGTGLKAIAYRISDKFLEQGGIRGADGTTVKVDKHERVYLIDSFWCYDPCGVELEISDLPASANGCVTFGSLNNFCKINEVVLKHWARILRKHPSSRLMMLTYEGSHRQRTIGLLAAEGIEPHRVQFATPRPRLDYLKLYHQLDIVLDTFPYGGHTTSLDALWMGVPVVSLCGERPVSRAGLSQLTNLGLPELVANSGDEYVKIATDLANDIPRLIELRATLRQRMEESVLMDGPHFARQIEAAYRAMWRDCCAKEKS